MNSVYKSILIYTISEIVLSTLINVICFIILGLYKLINDDFQLYDGKLWLHMINFTLTSNSFMSFYIATKFDKICKIIRDEWNDANNRVKDAEDEESYESVSESDSI